MDNILMKYLSERIEKEKDRSQNEPGPVITISRQYGCWASEIAEKLAANLNQTTHSLKKGYEWKWIAKEVIEDAAKDLNVDPSKIAHIFAANERSFLEDLAIAFSVKQYARDPQIKKLISKIVKDYAEQGHVVIVGRAGCILTKHIEKAIHVKIIAPDSWRINRIMTRYELNEKDAIKRIKAFDENRKTFMSFYRGNRPDADIFDLIVNRDKMSTDEIIKSISGLAALRDMV